MRTNSLRRARETAECIASVTKLPVQPDARLRERLNWYGSLPFDALMALCARTMQTATGYPRTGSHHGRQEQGCRNSPTCPPRSGLSRWLPPAESPSTCCATSSAMAPGTNPPQLLTKVVASSAMPSIRVGPEGLNLFSAALRSAEPTPCHVAAHSSALLLGLRTPDIEPRAWVVRAG